MKKRYLCALFLLACVVFGANSAAAQEEPAVLQPEEEDVAADSTELDTGNSSNSVSPSGKILDHIYLDTVDLSGMTVEEAEAAADQRMEEIRGYHIVLHMDDQSVAVTAKELGVSGANHDAVLAAAELGQTGNVIKRYKAKKDLEKEPLQIPMQYQVDTGAVRSALEQYCIPLNREVINYGLTHDQGVFQITAGQSGVALKLEDSIQTVENYLTEVWKDGIGNIELDVDITEPKGSQEELSRVKDVLGQGSTNYSQGKVGRAQNIKTGVEKLTGRVLYPGDSLSVCDLVTPFTEENGYQMAPSYANGEVVDSYGGGICQVSTTLYLAVIRAELEVTERYNHSMSVAYVKPSMDAAIAEGSKDLKFVNNLDAPVYIEGYAAGGTISFAIYGEEYRPAGRTVVYESETVETIKPQTQLTADTGSNLGSIQQTQSGHTGYRAKLWKVVTENGQETREEVNSSYYQMTPNKYKVGVKTDNAEASSAMYGAIALNDLNEVYVVLNKY